MQIMFNLMPKAIPIAVIHITYEIGYESGHEKTNTLNCSSRTYLTTGTILDIKPAKSGSLVRHH